MFKVSYCDHSMNVVLHGYNAKVGYDLLHRRRDNREVCLSIKQKFVYLCHFYLFKDTFWLEIGSGWYTYGLAWSYSLGVLALLKTYIPVQ